MYTLLYYFFIIILVPFFIYILADLCLFFIARPRNKVYDVTKCGTWAIITGAGAGIGKGYCLALAKRGLNICLIGRTLKTLEDTAQELETTYGIKTLIIQHDFSSRNNEDAENQLKDKLNAILTDVAVLVNNVGTMGSPDDFGRPFLQNSPNSLDFARNMISTNIDSAVLMTSLVSPALVQKRKGVIIYLGSACGITPIYGEAVYCATKIFMQYFGDSIRQELEPSGIFVLIHTPSFVRTKLIPQHAYDLFPSFIAPSPAYVAESALAAIGIQTCTDGCFEHSVQNNLLRLIRRGFPKRVTDWIARTCIGSVRLMNETYLSHLAKKKIS